MQAVLLTQDVDIIVQHIKGVLQTLSKKHKPQGPNASNPDCSPMYGDKAVSGWCCADVEAAGALASIDPALPLLGFVHPGVHPCIRHRTITQHCNARGLHDVDLLLVVFLCYNRVVLTPAVQLNLFEHHTLP